jgi:hypothetical protein
MFTLIRREITDHLTHLLLAIALSATIVGILVYGAFMESEEFVGLLASLGIFVLVGSCAMGVTQVYADRANKVSPFLATLAVTRGQILAARCIVGVVAILAVLVPVVVAAVLLLHTFRPPLSFYWPAIVEVPVTLFLVVLASYCMGLLIGTTTRKLVLVAGCLIVPLVVATLVVIEGFGLQAMAVLALLILASLVRSATKLFSTSL